MREFGEGVVVLLLLNGIFGDRHFIIPV